MFEANFSLEPRRAIECEFGVNIVNGIKDITLIKTERNIDTYAIKLLDGTQYTFTVTNGVGIVNITSETEGLDTTYTLHFNNDTTYSFVVSNGRGITNIQLTSTEELIDTYTIYYNDGTTSTYQVKNGQDAEASEEVKIVAKYIDNVNEVANNIDSVNTVAENEEGIKAVLDNLYDVQHAGENAVLARESAEEAEIWAEGTDQQVQALGGVHSSKVWSEIASEYQVNPDWNETDQASKAFILNKPTKLSDFNNDQAFISREGISATSPIDYNNSTGVISVNNAFQIPTLEEISLLNSALQPNNNISLLNNDVGYQTAQDVEQAISVKQDLLTSENAGVGISITGSGANVKINNTQTSAEWGNIQGDINSQVDLKNVLDLKVEYIELGEIQIVIPDLDPMAKWIDTEEGPVEDEEHTIDGGVLRISNLGRTRFIYLDD